MAKFDETVAGKEVASLVPVNGKCTRHSKSTSREGRLLTPVRYIILRYIVLAFFLGPRYHCNSNGEWKVRTGSCQCSPGYEPSADTKQCTGITISYMYMYLYFDTNYEGKLYFTV